MALNRLALNRRIRRQGIALGIALALVLAAAAPAAAYPRPGDTTRVSVSSEGVESNHESNHPAMSADGRFVAFTSQASNLVPDDTNGSTDVFVHDLASDEVERVSVSGDGVQGDRNSFNRPAISPDGRFVAFQSLARNLVPGEANNFAQVYVRDRQAGTTERVSVSNDGTLGNGISAQPALSADGRFVAFQSRASNLVPGDTNNTYDVFVHDRETGTTERMSVSSDGAQGNAGFYTYPSISADGRYVAFASSASNLVPGDTNNADDVFVHDRETGTTERVSVNDDGGQGDGHSWFPSISADGRYAAFISQADNLVPSDTNFTQDIFVRDRVAGTTERVSLAASGAEPNDRSYYPTISGDGRHVTFVSRASNLVPGDTNNRADIFVRDRETFTTERVSVSPDGEEADRDSGTTAISGDGRVVAFASASLTLVPGIGNNRNDIFVRDRGPALGAGAVSVSAEGDQLSVSGWARFSGQTITSAVGPGDGLPAAGPAGAELTEAGVLYRPEDEDLLVRLRLASMPSWDSWAVPWMLYGFAFEVAGTRFEVRSLSWATGSSLYRCDPDCAEQSRPPRSVGAAGPEVLVALPLAELGAEEGMAITGMRAFTALGTPPTGAAVVLDELDLPDGAIPVRSVSLGSAPAGTPANEIVFDTEATLADGRFSAAVAVPEEDHRVWARACVGEVCGSRSIDVPR